MIGQAGNRIRSLPFIDLAHCLSASLVIISQRQNKTTSHEKSKLLAVDYDSEINNNLFVIDICIDRRLTCRLVPWKIYAIITVEVKFSR